MQALGLGKTPPCFGPLTGIGQYGATAMQRRALQRRIACIHHALKQRLALFRHAKLQVGVAQHVKRRFMAGVELGYVCEQGHQQENDLVGVPIVQPLVGDKSQFLRRKMAEGQVFVGRHGNIFQHILEKAETLRIEGNGVLETRATVLVLFPRAALTGIVALLLGHGQRTKTVVGTRHMIPDFTEQHAAQRAFSVAIAGCGGERHLRRQRREGFDEAGQGDGKIAGGAHHAGGFAHQPVDFGRPLAVKLNIVVMHETRPCQDVLSVITTPASARWPARCGRER